MAACPVLRLLVTSSLSDLSVFSLPDSLDAKAGAWTLIRMIGGIEPLDFKFITPDEPGSGWMAFTGSTGSTGSTAAARLLVVTDAGNRAVHVVDVIHGDHVGYVAAPGSIARPSGVAAWSTKVAVCCNGNTLRLYEGSGETWSVMREIEMYSHVSIAHGLRFTGEGACLALAYRGIGQEKGCVGVFRVEDGSLSCTIPSNATYPFDLEDCGEHGWAVADSCLHSIEFIGGADNTSRLGEVCHPSALALVPGLGLVVREYSNVGRLQLFATADAIAMAAMSISKTTWMTAVARACFAVLRE
jgi:hypothetical protein